MIEENVEAKQKHEGKKTPHEEWSVTSEHRRVSMEKPKKLEISTAGVKELEKHQKVDTISGIKIVIPRPLIVHSQQEITSEKREPRIVLPLSITLNDRQRILLHILYNMFKGKKLKDLLPVIGRALELSVEDILREIIDLEKLNLVKLNNGVIKFTDKGEVIARSIVVDKNILDKIRELRLIVPRTPFVQVKDIHMKLLLDKEVRIAKIEVRRKELAVPSFPRLCISTSISPREVNKEVCNVPKYMAKDVTIPHIPRVAPENITLRNLDKVMAIQIGLQRERIQPTIRFVESQKARVRVKRAKPSSLLTMLFKSIKKYSVKGLLKVSPDRPVIIVAVKPDNDDYLGTLLSILREIYRIKVGGLPIGRYTGTKVTKYIAEDELMRQGVIKVIDDASANFLKFFGIHSWEDFDKIDIDKLRERLIEMSVQGLSFLVFYVGKDKASKLLTYLAMLRDKIAPVKIITISMRRLPQDLKKELARATWGFIDVEEPLETMDQHFKRREEKFYDMLEKVVYRRRYAKIVRESIEPEEGLEHFESALHYQLKAFMVHYLIEKLEISEEDIETEAEYQISECKIVPDIYVRSRRLAIEIETFYGTGHALWRKLERTIEKYKTSNVANEVWIVIPPLQTMLYLRDLVNEVKELRKKGYNFIKIFTVDLSRTELVPIEDLLKRLNKVFSKLAKL